MPALHEFTASRQLCFLPCWTVRLFHYLQLCIPTEPPADRSALGMPHTPVSHQTWKHWCLGDAYCYHQKSHQRPVLCKKEWWSPAPLQKRARDPSQTRRFPPQPCQLNVASSSKRLFGIQICCLKKRTLALVKFTQICMKWTPSMPSWNIKDHSERCCKTFVWSKIWNNF